MEVKGKKILVIGAGRSGVAAARFLAARGAVVALNDRQPLESWSPDALALKDKGVGCFGGDVPSWLLDQIELVVLSPGVPAKIIPARYAARAGAEVIGEVELAARFMRGRFVAITGTNGKTTTTALTAWLLRGAGLPVRVGGNIGTPLIDLVDASRDEDWVVAELSSFQLETVDEFHPTIAAVLNLTPDHMDRYESFTDYAAAKHNIFRNQTEGDLAVLNADDRVVASWAESGLRAHVTLFSARRELEEGLFLRGRDIVSRTREGRDNERVLASRDEMKLRGAHNVENAMAALAIGLACGASPESMRANLRDFDPVEHRLEFVAEIDGAAYYNDSKATNVDAAVKALEAFADDDPHKVVLILGGRGKNAPYAPLASLVGRLARRLVVIGEDADRIERELSEFALVERAADMNQAVAAAHRAAEGGDAVLLAPACASYDMFENYEHRGRAFKEAVMNLKK